MRYKYLTLLLCLFSAFTAEAQLTDTIAHFSLQEAVDYAQKYQISIQNAKIDEQIENEERQTQKFLNG